MDTDALVNEQKEDGQKLLDYLAGSGFEVQAAFWVKAAEDGRWHYYLVSPAVETAGLAQLISGSTRRFGADPSRRRSTRWA